jgi:hypothetical protein
MADEGSSTWPPMLWVGGTSGAGKSRLSWRLAHEHDLPLMSVDAYGQSTDAATAAGRVPMVIEEIRTRGVSDVTTVVEGPQLDPDLARALPAGHAAWLMASPERSRHVRRARGTEPSDAADEAPTEARAEADAALAQRLRRRARELGRPVVEVPLEADWDTVLAALSTALRPGLDRARRLEPGRPLSAARRAENDAAYRQLRRHEEVQGLVTPRRFPFGCECGRSRCAALWEGRPEEYAAAAAVGSVVTASHR